MFWIILLAVIGYFVYRWWKQQSAVSAFSPSFPNTVKFGSYYRYYDADSNDVQDEFGQKEPVEWIPVEKKDGKTLLVSAYVLDTSRFTWADGDPDMTWEIPQAPLRVATWQTSKMRAFLNTEFLDDAFTPEQQEQIVSVDVLPEKNPRHPTEPGPATNDKVFLLNTREAETYFPTNAARQTCYPHYPGKPIAWWLRTPGGFATKTAAVEPSGSISYMGASNSNVLYGVRPALWVSDEALS